MSRNSFGFTMVEVMIVLIFLGIVSAVAVPALNNTMDEIKLDGAAREVVSAIQYCQSLAIKEGTTYKVNFNVMQDRFKCMDVVTTLTTLHPIIKKPYEIGFQLEGHLQGVDIVSASFGAGNKSSVDFNMLGEFDDPGAVILGYAGLQKTINVTAPLGKVSVN